MAGKKQYDQHEHTFSSYVRIRDVALKTCQRRWTIGKSGERGSGISVLAARHDDDDEIYSNKSPLTSTITLSTISLFKLVNAAVIITFSSSLVLHKVFLVWETSKTSTPPHTHNNLGDCNVGSSAAWCWGKVVTEIFSQQTLGSPASVTWHRVPLPVIGSSSSTRFDSGQQYSLQTLDVVFRVEFEVILEDECRHDVTVASVHLKHCYVDWVFSSHHYWYILRRKNKPTVVLSFHYLVLTEKFVIWEKAKACSVGEWCLNLLKSLVVRYFLQSFMANDKSCPFLILCEKLQMSSCTPCLISNSDTKLWTWLTCWISPTNSWVLFLREQSE